MLESQLGMRRSGSRPSGIVVVYEPGKVRVLGDAEQSAVDSGAVTFWIPHNGRDPWPAVRLPSRAAP